MVSTLRSPRPIAVYPDDGDIGSDGLVTVTATAAQAETDGAP